MRGLFVRDDPGVLTDCETGWTWCFDATQRVLKCWDGSAWRHSCLTQYLVPVSDGSRFIAIPAGPGTAAQVLTSNGASAYPSFQAAAVATWLAELTGLGLSNAADADHDITIAVGACASYHATLTSRVLMNLTSALTKQIDAAWSVGTNAGGLFTGVVAANTTYHVFLIRRSDTGVVDGGFDTSASAANIPANYDGYRRIGSVVTNASANILAFVQDGDVFQLSTPVLDHNATNPGTSAVTVTLASVPTGINVIALVNASIAGASNTNTHLYLSDLATTDVAATPVLGGAGLVAPGATVGIEGSSGVNNGAAGQARVRTNTSAQIRSRANGNIDANTRIGIATLGWIDRRGRG